MKTSSFKALVVIVVAMGLWTAGAQATPQSLPILQGFEELTVDPISGTHGPLVFTGAVAIVDTAGDVIEGQQSLRMGIDDESAMVTLTIDTDEKNVWTLIYTKPAFNDDDIFELMAPDGDTALMMGVNTNGAVLMSDTGGWHTNQASIDAGTWVAFAINADYTERQYDVYLAKDAAYGGEMQRIGENLGFHQDYTEAFMTALEISTDLESYVDGLALSRSFTAVNGIANAAGTNLMVSPRRAGISVAPPRGDYSAAGSRQFNGLLGDLMKQGMSEGDDVRIYHQDAWIAYDYNVGTWVATPNEFPALEMGQAIQLAKIATNSMAFYAYDVNTVPTISMTMEDSGDLEANPAGGWNTLVWPNEATAQGADAWKFVGTAENDDRMIVFSEGAAAQMFWFKDGEWLDFNNRGEPATFVMPQNQSFWFRGVGTAQVDRVWAP